MGLICLIAGIVLFFMESYLIGTSLYGVAILFFIASFLYGIIPRKHVKKNRTTYVATYKCSVERVRFAINVFMIEKGFAPMKYLDEEVYKKGNGWWIMRKFIKCTINDDNTVTIEGWVATGVGSSVCTEVNLKGFLYGVPKKQLIQDIEQLKFRIGNLSD